MSAQRIVVVRIRVRFSAGASARAGSPLSSLTLGSGPPFANNILCAAAIIGN